MDKQKIYEVISKFLIEIITDYIPYKWEASEEPFYNMYKDDISYDYSGEVSPMTLKDVVELYEDYHNVTLDQTLEQLHINQWTATYISNYGKHWITFGGLLQERFNEWKYENFDIYDEETDEIDEELEEQIDDIYYSFLSETQSEIYLMRLLNEYKKREKMN